MRKSYILWLIGGLTVLLAFVAVACNGDDEDGDGAEPPPAATEEVIEEEEEEAAEVPGVTDTEVVLGAHTSLTGPIAAYNIIPRFTKAYFDYINETQGGVHGRMITYIQEDDQYSPPLAVDLTRRLVEQSEIFAMFNALGTPNHLQVIDYLRDRGVPDMFLATGAVEWVKDPSARPLVFGSNPNYTGEGLVAGKYITDNFPGGKVGIIFQNDDFGIDGVTGIKLGLGDGMEVVGEESYEVTDPSLFSQVDRLQAAGADVIAAWVTPLLLSTAIKHARQDLDWDVPFFITAVSMNELTQLLTGDDVIEGTVGPVATYMKWQTDNPGIANHLAILDQDEDLNSGMASVLTLYAQYVAELMVETLERAGPDLTRESLIEAAESIKDWTCSVCLYPLTLGPDDHDPGQGVAMGRYEIGPDGGRIVITGPAYSWEGVPVAELSVDRLEDLPIPE